MKQQTIKEGRANRQKKIDAIAQKLEGAKALIFNDYRGLSVLQISEIRKALREKGARMHVQKNRLAKRAAEDKKYPADLVAHLSGPTAITYVAGDEAMPVLKTLFEFVKKDYPLSVRAAFIENTVFNAEDAQRLSMLPSRDELLSMLMRTLNAPVQKLALTLNEIPTRVVRTLSAIADSKK